MKNSDPGETRPFWATRSDVPQVPPLAHDLQADVCVVGGGMAGLSAAYEAARAGRSVVVLERAEVASGETGRSTAQLATAVDDRYFEIERIHGQDGARLAAESHAAAIDRVERIVGDEGIDCGFERLDGYLFQPPEEKEDVLEEELRAAQRAGVAGVELLASTPAPVNLGRCLRFPRQAQMNPTRYAADLARAVVRLGGRVFAATHAQTIEGGAPARIHTAHGPIVTAKQVIVATNAPINDLFAVHLEQVAYRSYVITAAVPKGSVPKALYWDTLDPYHYVRIDEAQGRDFLIVGGEDHRTGQADDGYERFGRLEAWMRARFPTASAVESRWSGQVLEPSDGVAFIGRDPGGADNVFIVSGDSGMGITHGAMAGVLIEDLIAGRENPWAKLYAPSRNPLKDPGQAARDAAGSILPYTDWLKRGDVADESQIPVGKGAIVRHGLALLAVYRDPNGELHRCSAACPHLGAAVRWNDVEKSWDCPCHGSRFDALGKVLSGPANLDLARVAPKKQ